MEEPYSLSPLPWHNELTTGKITHRARWGEIVLIVGTWQGAACWWPLGIMGNCLREREVGTWEAPSEKQHPLSQHNSLPP